MAAATPAPRKKKKKLNPKAPVKTELAVALDFATGSQASKLLQDLKGLPVVYKVGLELFCAVGPDWVKARVEEGYRIFLDLKMHDIPNTVAKAALRAQELKVEMATFHLAGGPKMIRAARDEMEKKGDAPKILGVSVLTSFDQDTWDEVAYAVSGSKSKIEESVKRLVSQARFWGADGVVCSPQELKLVRKLDPMLYTVVPGIRPRGSAKGDQARVLTPLEAAKAGAHLIVVGRPITEAKNPRDAVERILKEIQVPPARTETK